MLCTASDVLEPADMGPADADMGPADMGACGWLWTHLENYCWCGPRAVTINQPINQSEATIPPFLPLISVRLKSAQISFCCPDQTIVKFGASVGFQLLLEKNMMCLLFWEGHLKLHIFPEMFTKLIWPKNWEIGKLLKWSFAAVGKKDIVETWSFGADSDNKGIFFFHRSHIHWYLGPFPVFLFLAFLFCYLPPFPFLFCCLQPLSLISWAQVHPQRSQQDMHSNLIASTLICRLFLFCFAVCHLFSVLLFVTFFLFCCLSPFLFCYFCLFCFVIFSLLLFAAFFFSVLLFLATAFPFLGLPLVFLSDSASNQYSDEAAYLQLVRESFVTMITMIMIITMLTMITRLTMITLITLLTMITMMPRICGICISATSNNSSQLVKTETAPF